MIYYIIPARAGSQRFPHKNQILFDYTANMIKDFAPAKNVIVTTNDEKIKIKAVENNFTAINRPVEIAGGDVGIKKVLRHVIKTCDMQKNDILVLLYLTYPGRKLLDVQKALKTFIRNDKIKNLLCKEDVLTHPHLCIYENGKKVIRHNYHSSQQYPKTFEVSHYIHVCCAKELKKLSKNLQNRNTYYYYVQRQFDIDTEIDYQKFLEQL